MMRTISAAAFGMCVGVWFTVLAWALVAFPLPSSVFVLMFSVALIAVLTTLPTWVRLLLHRPNKDRHAVGWSAVMIATIGAMAVLPQLPDSGVGYGSPVWAFAAASIAMLAAAATVDRGHAVTGPQDSSARGLLLDTSAWIDGRVVQLAEWDLLHVAAHSTHGVMDELKSLADRTDPTARARGRAGLDAIQRWRAAGRDLHLADDIIEEGSSVDERLTQMAHTHGWTLVTTDAPLEAHASARGVAVLNPHALMDSMRGSVRTGERFTMALTSEGQESGQAVGHLEDGTLVVVDGARGLVGRNVEIEVTRLLQTKTGRMVFAKLAEPTAELA